MSWEKQFQDNQERARATAVARRYRDDLSAGHGVVIINRDGQVCGWMDCLRNPSHWEPGCRAVDVNGSQWLAAGGNDYDGAERWEQDVVVRANPWADDLESE